MQLQYPRCNCIGLLSGMGREDVCALEPRLLVLQYFQNRLQRFRRLVLLLLQKPEQSLFQPSSPVIYHVVLVGCWSAAAVSHAGHDEQAGVT